MILNQKCSQNGIAITLKIYMPTITKVSITGGTCSIPSVLFIYFDDVFFRLVYYFLLQNPCHFHKSVLELLLTTLSYRCISRTEAFMILGSIPATCLTYIDCMTNETIDVYGVDSVNITMYISQ